MARLLRHRQTKAAETDRPILPPPRHIPTLPKLPVATPSNPRPLLKGIAEGIGEKADVQASTSAYHPKLTVTEAACRQPGIAITSQSEDAKIVRAAGLSASHFGTWMLVVGAVLLPVILDDRPKASSQEIGRSDLEGSPGGYGGSVVAAGRRHALRNFWSKHSRTTGGLWG